MSIHTPVFPVSPIRAAAARYLSCLRLPEILVLQGSPLLGAAFALRQPAAEHVGPLALLIAANVFLMAHVFMLNDWAGLPTDLADPNRAAGVFTNQGVGRREVGGLTAGLLAVSLLFVSGLGPVTLGLAATIAVLSALYSLPRFNWKGRPLLNSAAHLIGGTLHFLLGYSLGNDIDGRGVAAAVFFALIFAAGHLTQEIRDHQGDLLNGIRTNAVAFGRRRTFAASLVLFTLAQGLLLLLALQGTLPRPLAALVALYPIHLLWSREALSEGLTFASICRLQARYRVLYAFVGLAMVAALVAPGSSSGPAEGQSASISGILNLPLTEGETDGSLIESLRAGDLENTQICILPVCDELRGFDLFESPSQDPSGAGLILQPAHIQGLRNVVRG